MQKDTNENQKIVEKYTDNPLSKNVFLRVVKKTEKITTAIYMVTSLVDAGEPLRVEIRKISTTLLSDLFICLETPLGRRTNTLSRSIVNIEQLISLFEITLRVGFVSEMNATILKKELFKLQQILHQEIQQRTHFDNLREPYSEIEHHQFLSNFLSDQNLSEEIEKDIKDIQMSFKNNVFYNDKLRDVNNASKRHEKVERGESSKRRGQILEVLKTKKNITMKDLAIRITNCTEKTLQRDLATLIEQGYVEKKGAKRWSTYVYKG